MDFEFIQDEELRNKAIEEFNKTLNAKIQEEVSGLKRKNEELLGEKKSVQQKLEEYNKKLEGIDIEEAKKVLEQNKKQQKKQMLEDGRDEDYLKLEIQNRVSEIERDYLTRLEAESEAKKQATEKANKYESMYKDKVLTDKLRETALKSGCLATPAVLEDICNRGKQVFSLNAKEDNIEARDADGNLRKTEDGSMILTPETWIASLKSQYFHYFPPSESTGSKGTTRGGSNREDILERMAVASREQNMTEYRRLRSMLKK